jgi:hypothetical protein
LLNSWLNGQENGMADNSVGMAPPEELLHRVRNEFLEMPGLCLTLAQAQRLWGLDAVTCFDLLAVLTGNQFLWFRADGTYARTPDGAASPPRRCGFLPTAPRKTSGFQQARATPAFRR